MQRRVIAAIAALLLAGMGAALIFTWVSNADARAMAGQDPTDVLVVVKDAPLGTLGRNLTPYVEVRKLPKSAIAANALASLNDVQDLATTTELKQGEQVLLTRFAAPNTSKADGSSGVTVPNDMQQMTLNLEAQRIIGGVVSPGNKIALYVTLNGKTGVLLREVLVVRASGAVAADQGATGSPVALTLALAPADIQRVIAAGEGAKIWAALESKDRGSDPIPINVTNLVGK